MNSGARVVNSALVCTQRDRRDGIQNCDRERKRREEDLPPRSLPSNSLFIFISFYWLIFNTIHFLFIYFSFLFILTLRALLLFSLFCHGDGYKHTPNWHAPRWGLHDISTILIGWGLSVVAIPYVLHTFCVGVQHTSSCGFIYSVYGCGRLFCSTPSVWRQVWNTHLRVESFLFRTFDVVGLFYSKPSVSK